MGNSIIFIKNKIMKNIIFVTKHEISHNIPIYSSYIDTKLAIEKGESYIKTFSMANLSMELLDRGYRIFLEGDKLVEIKEDMPELGKSLSKHHNILRLFISGIFDRLIYNESEQIPNEAEEKAHPPYKEDKKWRGDMYDLYWYIDEHCNVVETTDMHTAFDDEKYTVGNYFQSKYFAQVAAECVKEVLYKFHKSCTEVGKS